MSESLALKESSNQEDPDQKSETIPSKAEANDLADLDKSNNTTSEQSLSPPEKSQGGKTISSTNQIEEQKFDHYGFKVTTDEKKLDEKKLKSLQKRDNARIEKWRKMLPNLQTLIQKQDTKIKERIRKGIPESLRGRVWPLLADVETLKKAFPDINYAELLKTENIPFKEDITKDVPRTFPEHYFFKNAEDPGQKSLERVLTAVSLVYKEMGYCQGLNYICAVLVLYCNDEEAFWIMISLMKNYELLNYYKDLSSVCRQLVILDELIKIHLPKLWTHFTANQVESVHYGVNWWMTLFTGTFGMPFNIVVRIMDTLLFEKQKILYRVSLAVLKVKEKELLAQRGITNILTILTKQFREPQWEDEDEFFKLAFGIQLSKKDIEKIGTKVDSTSQK